MKAVNASFYNVYEFNTLRKYNKMWKELLVENNTLNDHERRDFVKDLYLMCQYEVDYSFIIIIFRHLVIMIILERATSFFVNLKFLNN